jgi:nucleoside phosphorylase
LPPALRSPAVVAARSPCDVLVLAAFDPELSSLREVLGPGLKGRVGTSRIEARAVGIGLVASAVGAARILRAPLPRAVVLIGTCGAYARVDRAAPAIGQAVVAAGVRLVDVGAVLGVTELPSVLATLRRSDAGLRAVLVSQGVSPVEVATTLGVTVDDEAAARVARTGAEVEHLEAFSVASACEAAGVAFVAVFGVSNVVGSSAREQWRAHHRAASGAAATEVVRWLERGAAGLAPVAD